MSVYTRWNPCNILKELWDESKPSGTISTCLALSKEAFSTTSLVFDLESALPWGRGGRKYKLCFSIMLGMFIYKHLFFKTIASGAIGKKRKFSICGIKIIGPRPLGGGDAGCAPPGSASAKISCRWNIIWLTGWTIQIPLYQQHSHVKYPLTSHRSLFMTKTLVRLAKMPPFRQTFLYLHLFEKRKHTSIYQ